MATRTKQEPKPGVKAKARPTKTRPVARGKVLPPKRPAADLDPAEPDRSAPPLAEVDAEALEFIAAIDRFKKKNGRPFPSWSEVLLVLRQLGYRRS